MLLFLLSLALSLCLVNPQSIPWQLANITMPVGLSRQFMAYTSNHFIIFGGRNPDYSTSSSINSNLQTYFSDWNSISPSASPTYSPLNPTIPPTSSPFSSPTPLPTISPTVSYSISPTLEPTSMPISTFSPTDYPSKPTNNPSLSPTASRAPTADYRIPEIVQWSKGPNISRSGVDFNSIYCTSQCWTSLNSFLFYVPPFKTGQYDKWLFIFNHSSILQQSSNADFFPFLSKNISMFTDINGANVNPCLTNNGTHIFIIGHHSSNILLYNFITDEFSEITNVFNFQSFVDLFSSYYYCASHIPSSRMNELWIVYAYQYLWKYDLENNILYNVSQQGEWITADSTVYNNIEYNVGVRMSDLGSASYLLFINYGRYDFLYNMNNDDLVCVTQTSVMQSTYIWIDNNTQSIYKFGGHSSADNEDEQNAVYFWTPENTFSVVLGLSVNEIGFGDAIFVDIINVSQPCVEDGTVDYEYLDLERILVIQILSEELQIDKYMVIINSTSTANGGLCYFCEEYSFVNDDNILSELLSDVEEDECTVCTTGITPVVESTNDYITNHSLELNLVFVSDGMFAYIEDNATIDILLTVCDAGEGISDGSIISVCKSCPFNEFTLKAELKPCISCSRVSEGLTCEGNAVALLTYNYWVAAQNHSTLELESFYDITYNDSTIITALCPPKYCCQTVAGCDYLPEYLEYYEYTTNYPNFEQCNNCPCLSSNTQYEYCNYPTLTSKLCAEGRDITIPLCGACLPDHAEMLGTTKCGICETNNFPQGLITIFIVTFVVAIFLVYFDGQPPQEYKKHIKKRDSKHKLQFNEKKLLMMDDFAGLQTLIFKPILYYYQSLSPILNTRGLTLWLSPIISFFNFSLDTFSGSDNSGGFCWSTDLNANTEILLNIVIPMYLMFHLIPYFCQQFKCCQNCCRKCRCCKFCKREAYVKPAFFRILLITIGIILTVCFKYITWIDIGGETLMFYSASNKAFGPWWFAGFFGIILVIFIFCILFYKIYHQTPEERYSSQSIYRKFIKSFVTRFWYWEFVLFSRRFFIAFFTAIQFVGKDYSNFIFIVILILYLVVQVYYKPYAWSRVNQTESVCLVLLIVAFVAVNFVDVDDGNVFVGSILSFCISIPLLILIYFIGKYLYQSFWIYRFHYEQYSEKPEIREKVEHVLTRLPKSYKNIVLGDSGNMNLGVEDNFGELKENVALAVVVLDNQTTEREFHGGLHIEEVDGEKPVSFLTTEHVLSDVELVSVVNNVEVENQFVSDADEIVGENDGNNVGNSDVKQEMGFKVVYDSSDVNIEQKTNQINENVVQLEDSEMNGETGETIDVCDSNEDL